MNTNAEFQEMWSEHLRALAWPNTTSNWLYWTHAPSSPPYTAPDPNPTNSRRPKSRKFLPWTLLSLQRPSVHCWSYLPRGRTVRFVLVPTTGNKCHEIQRWLPNPSYRRVSEFFMQGAYTLDVWWQSWELKNWYQQMAQRQNDISIASWTVQTFSNAVRPEERI